MIIAIQPKKELFTSDLVFQNPHVEVKNSTVAGRGVFALKNFDIGDIIEVAPSLIDDCVNFSGKVNDYITYVTQDKNKCALHMGYFNYYNHQDDNNANYYLDETSESIKIIAIKQIKKGEEIFVNYGNDYWTTRKERLYKL